VHENIPHTKQGIGVGESHCEESAVREVQGQAGGKVVSGFSFLVSSGEKRRVSSFESIERKGAVRTSVAFF